VEAATWRTVARWERKAATCSFPISLGCRTPWKKMKRRIHWRYAFSVLSL
jgi:hypothetical protein